MHIPPQLGDLLREVLFLAVYHEQSSILTGIEAREGGAEDFNKVAHASQVLVHVPEVGVDMVTIPVQRVILHSQVIPGEVTRWVAEVVVLVPENSLAPWRSRNYLHLNWELHG